MFSLSPLLASRLGPGGSCEPLAGAQEGTGGRSPGGLQFLCRLGPLGTGLGAALAALCAVLLRFASSCCAGTSRAAAGGDSPAGGGLVCSGDGTRGDVAQHDP